jgi:hypothetical protein
MATPQLSEEPAKDKSYASEEDFPVAEIHMLDRSFTLPRVLARAASKGTQVA